MWFSVKHPKGEYWIEGTDPKTVLADGLDWYECEYQERPSFFVCTESKPRSKSHEAE